MQLLLGTSALQDHEGAPLLMQLRQAQPSTLPVDELRQPPTAASISPGS